MIYEHLVEVQFTISVLNFSSQIHKHPNYQPIFAIWRQLTTFFPSFLFLVDFSIHMISLAQFQLSLLFPDVPPFNAMCECIFNFQAYVASSMMLLSNLHQSSTKLKKNCFHQLRVISSLLVSFLALLNQLTSPENNQVAFRFSSPSRMLNHSIAYLIYHTMHFQQYSYRLKICYKAMATEKNGIYKLKNNQQKFR